MPSDKSRRDMRALLDEVIGDEELRVRAEEIGAAAPDVPEPEEGSPGAAQRPVLMPGEHRPLGPSTVSRAAPTGRAAEVPGTVPGPGSSPSAWSPTPSGHRSLLADAPLTLTPPAGELSPPAPAVPGATGPAPKPPAIAPPAPDDPVLAGRRARRRRSAALLPTLLTPADVPEDAEGRVVFITASTPDEGWADDGAQPGGWLSGQRHADAAESTSWDRRMDEPESAVDVAGVWFSVAVFAVILVVAFSVGMVVFR